MTETAERLVLAIEDDPETAEALRTVAHELGMVIRVCSDGLEGLRVAEHEQIDLMIVDLGLPSIGGAEICRRIRSLRSTLPIVILTARADELNTVLGLELGADDYVTKPFRMLELVARIRAIFRRVDAYSGKAGAEPKLLSAGDVTVNFDTHQVTKAGCTVPLSRTEFDLLAYFMLNPGVVLTREQLMGDVWGYQCNNFDGTVTTFLSRLRSKIEDDPNEPKMLITIRGVGYRFVLPDSSE